jgi:hypothetical protein
MIKKYIRNTGKPYQPVEIKQIKELTKSNTPTRVIGLKLGRSEGGIRNIASKNGISLKPVNQSPYNRKSK